MKKCDDGIDFEFEFLLFAARLLRALLNHSQDVTQFPSFPLRSDVRDSELGKLPGLKRSFIASHLFRVP